MLLSTSLIVFQLILSYFDKISGKWLFLIIVLIELLVFVSVFFIISKEIKKSDNFKDGIYNIFNQYLPKSIAKWVIFEVSIFTYAFYGFSKFFKIPSKEGWTYYKNSNFPMIFALLILIAPVEIFAVHYLLNITNIFINAILIFLYIVSVLYIYGFWVSIKLNPHTILGNNIFLYRGCLSKTTFPINLVKSLEVVSEIPKLKEKISDFTIPGGEIVEISFFSQAKIENLFDEESRFADKVFVSVDNSQEFCNHINQILSSKN
jgi:hypothetical protein